MASISQFDPNDPLYVQKLQLAARKIAEDKAKQEAAKKAAEAASVAGVANAADQEAISDEQKNVSSPLPSDEDKRSLQQRMKGLTNIDKKA